MSATTSIEWTDRTWNPVTGCTKVSPGCKHCYAEGVANRFWATQYDAVLFDSKKNINTVSTSHHEYLLANGLARPRRFTDVQTHTDRLLEPLTWRTPARIFVNSMSDLFHEDVPDAFIDQVFAVMALAQRHTFQILTKRAERLPVYVSKGARDRIANIIGAQSLTDRLTYAHSCDAANRLLGQAISGKSLEGLPTWPLPNVWIGVSVEDQQRADERIPDLLATPAAVRFISAEPLLGKVDLTDYLWTIPGARLNRLHWVIVGGESGSGARPFDVSWARWLVAQGRSADVPVFVKQLGARPFGRDERCRFQSFQQWVDKAGSWLGGVSGGGIKHKSPERSVCTDSRGRICSVGADFMRARDEESFPVVAYAEYRLHDRKGGTMSEWPEDLRVREFPCVAAQ